MLVLVEFVLLDIKLCKYPLILSLQPLYRPPLTLHHTSQLIQTIPQYPLRLLLILHIPLITLIRPDQLIILLLHLIHLTQHPPALLLLPRQLLIQNIILFDNLLVDGEVFRGLDGLGLFVLVFVSDVVGRVVGLGGEVDMGDALGGGGLRGGERVGVGLDGVLLGKRGWGSLGVGRDLGWGWRVFYGNEPSFELFYLTQISLNLHHIFLMFTFDQHPTLLRQPQLLLQHLLLPLQHLIFLLYYLLLLPQQLSTLHTYFRFLHQTLMNNSQFIQRLL